MTYHSADARPGPNNVSELRIYKHFRLRSAYGDVYCEEASTFLASLNPGSADLIFLDPPFNLGKDYGKGPSLDRRLEKEYEEWLADILESATRILSDGGSLFLYHLPKWAMRCGVILEAGLTFRHWIAVSMKNGFVRGNRLYPAHYALLYYTKGEPRGFQRPRLPITICRHCGNPIKDYGGYRKIIEEKGVNVSDIWDDISPVRHRSTKARSANELPAKMMNRIMEIAGAPGFRYVDPFAGSGSGTLAAAHRKMTFTVNDWEMHNCEIICDRLGRSEGLNKECAHAGPS